MKDKYITLSLSDYFNSKLILNKKDVKKSSEFLTNIGARSQPWHLFDSESLPQSLEIVNVLGIPFLFPDKAFDNYDSISCEGQRLDLDDHRYKAIHIMATAFDGVYCYEKLKVWRVEDSHIELDIYFKEWYFLAANTNWEAEDNNMPECHVAIKGTHLFDYSTRCIYYNKCILGSAHLKALELPCNPDLYIIAITMELE